MLRFSLLSASDMVRYARKYAMGLAGNLGSSRAEDTEMKVVGKEGAYATSRFRPGSLL